MWKYFFILPFFLSVQIGNVAAQDDDCGQPADIIFVIDSSLSIWQPDFERQIAFIGNISSKFAIGPNKTRIGAVSFSVSYREEFGLKTHKSKPDLLQAVSDIEFMMGDMTETYAALSHARDVMFTDARPGIPHIMIVLTDGKSADVDATQAEAALARDEGIEIISIGIGYNVDFDEVFGMASEPKENNSFIVSGFSQLNSIESLLMYSACKSTTTTTTTTTTPPTTTTVDAYGYLGADAYRACGGKPADVIFVLDISSSIEKEDFIEQQQFVSDVIDVFDIGPDMSQIALVSFSGNASVDFFLNGYTDKSEIQKHVMGLNHTGGKTYTDKALELVAQDVLKMRHGFRRTVAHVVIVITDGMSADPDRTAAVAAKLKEKGSTVFAIGVSNNTDVIELNSIASEPSKEFVYQINGYGALRQLKNILAIKTCNYSEPLGLSDQPVQCSSRRKVDLVYTTDFSGADHFDVDRSLNIVKESSNTLNIGEDKIRVGLVANQCPKVNNINLNKYYYPDEFADAVVPKPSKPLNELLVDARKMLVTPRKGSRKGAKRVAVVLVNGPISDLKQSSIEVLNGCFRKIEFVFVRAGSRASPKDLDQLSDGPVLDFESFSFRQDLERRVCQVVSDPPRKCKKKRKKKPRDVSE